MTEWYYLEGGQQHGPVTLADLRSRLAELPPDTLVWHSGLSEWRPAAALPETAARVAAPQVPGPQLSQVVGRHPPVQRSSVLPSAPPSYANWLLRAAAMLVDQVVFFGVPLVAFGIIAGLGLTDEKGDPTGFGLVIFIPACGFALAVGIWNRILRDGKTGQSLGRQLTGTRLIGLATGAPIGLGKVLLRQLCHLLDNLPCVCLPLGFLWPLWDERRQTFADKIVGSIVVREGNQMLREGQMAVDLHEVPITKVTLTGRELTFPRTCCCCGRPAEREAALSAEKATFVVVGTIRRTLTVSVPCCEFCGPHVEWANRGGFWRLIPMAIPALLGSMLVSGCLITLPFVVILGTVGVSSETSMASYPYILGGGTVLVVLAWLAWEARKRPKETPGPRHVCGHGAAYIKRFDADTTTLNFLNANYAQEVVRMNPAKVVKVESSTAAKEA